MKKRCFSFWFVSLLLFSSHIAMCAEKKPGLVKKGDVEKEEQVKITNKWLWNAAKAVGVVGLVALATYNFLTTPSITPQENVVVEPENVFETKPEIVSDQFLHTSISNMPVFNTPADVQSQISEQEEFRRRVVFNQLRTMAVSFALQGIFNAAVFTALSLFSLPASPVVPGGLLFASALLTPGAYYYRGTKLPSEARDISLFKVKHPTPWDYVKRLLMQKMLGESSDLWKY